MNPIATLERPPVIDTNTVSQRIGRQMTDTLGQYLKEHREKNKKTIRDVAENIGVNYTYISKFENDHSIPNWDMLIRLCEEYGIPNQERMRLADLHLRLVASQEYNMALAFKCEPS